VPELYIHPCDLKCYVIRPALSHHLAVLLLPEVSIGKGTQINYETSKLLNDWIKKYRGSVPLAISEGHTNGLPTCEPFITETGLTAFAHIDASGILKRSSYDTDGIAINSDGVLITLQKLDQKRI
jgi:hypothetical protein